MALSNKEKQEALRQRRATLGFKRVEFYLKEDEKKEVKQFIIDMRQNNKQ